MATLARHYPQAGLWRFTQQDFVFVGFATFHAILLLAKPIAPFIAVALWWNANTIAHNFIHKPFFLRPWMNRLFAAALSLLMGIPQTLWRDRHLAHHADREPRLRLSWQLAWEATLVLCLWSALLLKQPHFFAFAYLPGYLAGLALCWAQGYWEHAAGETDQSLRVGVQPPVFQRWLPRRASRRSVAALDGAAVLRWIRCSNGASVACAPSLPRLS